VLPADVWRQHRQRSARRETEQNPHTPQNTQKTSSPFSFRPHLQNRLPAVASLDEREFLTEYLYRNAVLPGSGEYCLNRLLTITVDARKPAVHRIPSLNVRSVAFLYGEVDWMDASGGLLVQQRAEQRRKGGLEAPEVEVYGIRNAGHLLMLENYQEFNAAVAKALGCEHRLPEGAARPKAIHFSDEVQFFRRTVFRERDGKVERANSGKAPSADADADAVAATVGA